jgi:hypothetical protein
MYTKTGVKNSMEKISKRVDNAFGKKIYLLGIETDNTYVWMEKPSWDCGWYWGFGYIETYTDNKHPSKARDITSHSHYKGSIVGQMEKYDFDKKCFVKDEYIHHINENKKFKATTLTDKESWKLSELMETAYTLKDCAALFGKGNSHISPDEYENEIIKNTEISEMINKQLLPKIFNYIDDLLSRDDLK